MAEIPFYENPPTPDDIVTIPDGYICVPTGNHYLTRTIKQLCNQRKKDVYRRMEILASYTKTTGYFAPAEIIEEAKLLDAATEKKRAAQRAKADAQRKKLNEKYRKQFQEKLFELFPAIPYEASAVILASQCAGKMDLVEEAVKAAVEDYVRRHCTDYEVRCSGIYWEETLDEIKDEMQPEVEKVMEQWREKLGPPK